MPQEVSNNDGGIISRIFGEGKPEIIEDPTKYTEPNLRFLKSENQ